MSKLSDEQKIEIVNKYKTGNYTCASLAREYKIASSSMWELLKKRGVKINNNLRKLMRKYHVNDNYFDIIDTEHKAYWLGLLYADGCNYLKRNSIQISLQEEDKYILDIFNKDLESNKPLQFSERSKKNKKWKNAFILRIISKNISDRLSVLGCVQRKSLTLTFPTEKQVPKHLLHHFLRGVWDGDGSINSDNINSFACELCSTIYFCDTLKNLLEKELDVVSKIYRSKQSIKKDNSTRRLIIYTNNKCKKFLDWLYKDSTIHLDRKYQKYLQCKEIK